ncbi:Lysophospholipase L1-like esterase (fragment) [Candidatus Sulfopaludibacter sp. SbA3]
MPDSYFMACGFKQGYFGIQELRPGQDRVVLFSVWDPGAQNDPRGVPAEQRVEVLYHAEDVVVRRFGGEGTGGQSFYHFAWKTGQTYRFLVEAIVEDNKTAFAAYFFQNETGAWKHLVTFRTITGGTPLTGYYSFIEDFRRDGKSVQERRRARFGNGWIKALDGNWSQLTEARFTADATPVDNIDAVVQAGAFALATGGETEKHTELQTILKRPPSNQQPPHR